VRQLRREPVPQLPAHAPFNQPVQRMSEQAKRDWPATPETVRGDIHRMHQEFAKAAQYYKADHEAMKPIRRFHEMAQQHGTTLEAALTNYTSMEQKLRADPVGGLDVIVNNLGLKAPDGQQDHLRDCLPRAERSPPISCARSSRATPSRRPPGRSAPSTRKWRA
jgi:hypothetical protein